MEQQWQRESSRRRSDSWYVGVACLSCITVFTQHASCRPCPMDWCPMDLERGRTHILHPSLCDYFGVLCTMRRIGMNSSYAQDLHFCLVFCSLHIPPHYAPVKGSGGIRRGGIGLFCCWYMCGSSTKCNSIVSVQQQVPRTMHCRSQIILDITCSVN